MYCNRADYGFGFIGKTACSLECVTHRISLSRRQLSEI